MVTLTHTPLYGAKTRLGLTTWMELSQQLPHPNEDPELFHIVKILMIRGPCGHTNHKSPCMDNEKCTKRYPRHLRNDTQTGDDGYPLYRRKGSEDGGSEDGGTIIGLSVREG